MSRSRRTSKTSRACLMTELLEEIANRPVTEASPAYNQFPPTPLSRREKLLLHLSVFMVGSGSLFMINLGRDPQHLWFWPWVAGWAALLAIHGAWTLRPSRPRGSSPAGWEAAEERSPGRRNALSGTMLRPRSRK